MISKTSLKHFSGIYRKAILFVIIFLCIAGLFLFQKKIPLFITHTVVSGLEGHADEKIHIATQIPFLADMIRKVGKDKVDVLQLDMHEGMSDAEIRAKKESGAYDAVDIFFVLSKKFGRSTYVLADRQKQVIVDLEQFISARVATQIPEEDEEALDPVQAYDASEIPLAAFKQSEGYYWFSIPNAQEMLRYIARVLSERDPDNRIFYLNNAYDYTYVLSDVRAELKGNMAGLNKKSFFSAGSGSWKWLLEDYDIEPLGEYATDQWQISDAAARMDQLVKDVKKKKGYIVGDLSFPTSLLKSSDTAIMDRLIILDPFGMTSGISTYERLVEEAVTQVRSGVGN